MKELELTNHSLQVIYTKLEIYLWSYSLSYLYVYICNIAKTLQTRKFWQNCLSEKAPSSKIISFHILKTVVLVVDLTFSFERQSLET